VLVILKSKYFGIQIEENYEIECKRQSKLIQEYST